MVEGVPLEQGLHTWLPVVLIEGVSCVRVLSNKVGSH